VGMGALHSAVVELGGQLHVQSQFGSGTRLQMLFPATAAAH
jgi:chemotaxis protein histidine kinase CheA